MKVRKIESLRSARKKRAAAYARISTDAAEQVESFHTQVNHYRSFIKENPKWEYVGVYADPGRSGVSAKNRVQFQKMIADAKSGKIDVIIVKSISRFARNVADALGYVHELKSLGVEVLFETEGISSFEPSSDMVFNVLATIAQEESRQISENVKWSYRRHAELGIRRIGNNRVLGYDEIDGRLAPNADAWIVKRVFEDYVEGRSFSQIAKSLAALGAKRVRSAKPFCGSIVKGILENEIYMGDRHIQKSAPINCFTKKPEYNKPYTSFYLPNNHEAIVDRDTWEAAACRLNLNRAKQNGKAGDESYSLYGRVFCAQCGACMTRVVLYNANEIEAHWSCPKGHDKGDCF